MLGQSLLFPTARFGGATHPVALDKSLPFSLFALLLLRFWLMKVSFLVISSCATILLV